MTSEGVKDAIDNAVGGLTIPEELDDLSDVTITSPSNGEILVFDGAEWVNQANPASTANFAADYDDTATYNTNDKVIYNGLYYIALEDSITGAWDSTKWALTTVSALTADELPLSGNDSTPTATAIGDLTQLTTSVTSSLVGAVNEVDGKVKTVFKLGTFSKTYSVGANNSTNFDNSFITVPTGYKIGALLGSGTGNANCYFVNCRPSDSGAYAFFITNKSVSNLSDLTCTCYVLFVREDTIST